MTDQPRRRFVVHIQGYADREQQGLRVVGPFFGVRTAVAWAKANAYDKEGFAYRWSVEPLEFPFTRRTARRSDETLIHSSAEKAWSR